MLYHSYAHDYDSSAGPASMLRFVLSALLASLFLTRLSSAFTTVPCLRGKPTVATVGAAGTASAPLSSGSAQRTNQFSNLAFTLGLSAFALRRRSRVPRMAGFGGSGLSGKWGCYKTEGDIDAYWKAAGLPWLARKGLQLMDWGAGKNQNVREFAQKEDDIEMEYSFQGPGLGGLGFTEKYQVGSGVQEITRMGGAKIFVDPIWESDSILRVTLPG